MSMPHWLKEPESITEPVVYVSIPEGAALTPEIEAALKQLGKSLQDAGKHAAEPKRSCLPYSCNLNQCQPYTRKHCFVYLTCKIIE